MAKVKSMGLRNYIGKLGGAVYYVNKGQNIGRELAASVSNPRTDAQQTQRMRWANLVAFYRSNQPWMKSGAFETKKQTWSDYNAFVSANSAVSPVYLTKPMAAAGGGVVAPYVVTRGSLPSIGVINSDGGGGYFVCSLRLGEGYAITDSTAVSDLSAALLANNSELREGDQISFIANLQTFREGVPYVVTRPYELIINSEDTRTLEEIGLAGVLSAEDYDDVPCLAAPHGGVPMGGTFILSRTISGAIKVSTQNVVLNAAALDNLALFTSESAFRAAANSYGVTEENFLASGYQGQQGGIGPVEQSIVSLQVGDLTFATAAEIGTRNDFGEINPPQIQCTMAIVPSNISAAAFTYFDRSEVQQTQSVMPATINGKIVTLSAEAMGNLWGNGRVTAFSITADGVEYTF